MVAAVVVPEGARRALEAAVRTLKAKSGVIPNSEAKLNLHSEDAYLEFLGALSKHPILLFCTATDAGLYPVAAVTEHQRGQVAGVLHHIDKLRYEGGRQALERMAGELQELSPQLYVQLTCQINLMYIVAARSLLYFAPRIPVTLREVRWRIDQKDVTRTPYELAFQRLSPPLLQTRSINEPIKMVHGFDYSHMQQYIYAPGEFPSYLKDVYGVDATTGLNARKLFCGDMRFVDSKHSLGIQAADLIASGIRKCLRGEFLDNEAVAVALGKLMVQAERDQVPLDLVTFGIASTAPPQTATVVRAMKANCKPMLK